VYDRSGSLFAIGMRLTRLNTVGAPLVGANNAYITDALVTAGIGLEYTDGEAIEQRNGSGNLCLSFRAPDSLTRGTISDLSVCSPDPNVLAFAIGGDVITRAAVSEVHTITITGTPTGGTFTLTYNAQTTAAIAFDAAAAAVQSALEALSNVDPGDLVVTGGPGPGTPYVVTWDSDLGNVVQMSANGAFTGGVAPAVAVTTTTPGTNFTDIGYRAPEVGVDPNPNGVSIELWSRAILDGAGATELPYLHWVIPRAYVRPSDAWTLSGEDPLLPAFEGFSIQNANWGDGPVGDWPFLSDRVWQFARVDTAPDFTPGFLTVV
jgi:hypothetical protein